MWDTIVEWARGSFFRERNRNRLWEDQARVGLLPARLVGVAVLIAAPFVLYSANRGQCKFVQREIKSLEVAAAKLENELLRERAKWGERKEPANLMRALDKFEIAMGYPTERQVVMMTVLPGGTTAGRQPLVSAGAMYARR
ncbi:MAG: hypothetical protein FWF84_00395 [Kiritimatiellaeota bacterium]|nr:hypothetical protein [Kiritimatiellota bacterium]